MNQAQFTRYKEAGYNRIPLTRKILADLDTPLSAYRKVAKGPYSYLFESIQGGEKWGRYSIIGLPCKTRLEVRGHSIFVKNKGITVEECQTADPLSWIQNFQARYRVPELPNLPRFCGGLVGYFSYDTIRYIEDRLANCPNPDTMGTPDILLLLSEEVLVFDNLSGTLHILIHIDPGLENAYLQGQKRLDILVQKLRESTVPISKNATIATSSITEADFVSGFSQADYKAAVHRIKDYIFAGDTMQVVLSQRLSIPYSAPTLNLYRALRTLNPSPYMYYLNLDQFQIVGSSPEILTRLEQNRVTVRPIAGTRPRGKNEQQDHLLEQELLADPKERAEHLMLIDLGRNDVGRVAKVGTIRLTEKMLVERYSHVMHIVSNVCGELQNGLSAIDVLRATFPAGTVSGAPKIRAMEIIDELEPVRRGIYSGAVGYIGWSGSMDTAIAIRTAVIKDGTLHIQVGAGIVADSIPQQEWEETINKGRAIFRAVAMAESGLDGASECC